MAYHPMGPMDRDSDPIGATARYQRALAQSDAPDVPYAHFRFELHGSIALLRSNDAGSLYWLSETAPEDAQWYGEALVVRLRRGRRARAERIDRATARPVRPPARRVT
jgi:hypothetical protein